MLILILINFIVVATSSILSRKLFRFRQLSDYFLISFILFFAQIVLVELFLGIIGQFHLQNLFLVNLLIFLIVFLLYRNKGAAALIKPDLSIFIDTKLVILAFSVFSAFFLVKAFINLINPPLSPDSLQYHLAFPATWIRSAKLDNPFVIFGGIFNQGSRSLEGSGISYFPINADLFFAWLMMPLRNAFLADLGEAPFYFVGIIAIYSILRKYAVNKKVALLSGFLWAIIPNIFKQLKTGSQIDVICAVLFILVIDTLLLLKEEFSFKRAILFGISIGLFVGTKIINIVWLAALAPLVLYILYGCIKTNRPGFKRVVFLLINIILMVVLFGGFMYIKNFIFTGNPIFPAEIKIFGKTILKGLIDKAAYNINHASGDRFDLARFMFKEGLGVQFLALILPGLFLPVLFFGYLRKRLHPFMEYFLLFITPLVMLVLYSVFLNVYVVRYLFAFLSLGLVTAIIFISKLPRTEKYLVFISFISILASAFELAHRYELIFSLLLALLFFIVLLLYKKQIVIFYKSKAFGKIMIVTLAIGLIFLFYLNKKYNKEEFQRYPLSFSRREAWQADIAKGWQKLNELTKDGARVAYTGRQEFYPLFGSRLKNDVKYVSVNEKEATPYNSPDGLCRKIKDFGAWRKNLNREKIGYLFIALPFPRNRESDDPAKFPIEDEWASSHPGDFQLLFSNSLCRIYKVQVSSG